MKIVSYCVFLIIAKSLAHNQELKNKWGQFVKRRIVEGAT